MVDYVTEFVYAGDFGNEWGDEYYDEYEDDDEPTSETEIGDPHDFVVSTRRKTRRLTKVPYESYKVFLRKQREREAAIREEEKREKFRKLMGMKLRRAVDGESVKTELSCAVEEEKIEETSSEDESDICLKNIDISDSQLKLDVDEDLLGPEKSETFWSTHRSSKTYKDDGIQKFFDLAYEMGLRPIKSMKEILQTDTLNLRYYGIDPRIVQAIVEAIEQNTSIQIIDLTENWLTADACEHLNRLLLRNEIISQLNLAGCRIGAEGVKNLQDGIATAPGLTDLNLSRCEIGDEGLEFVASPIYLNETLENVNLADNKLEEKGADYLSAMVAQTGSLKSLDLSHNRLAHRIFAETFFQGLTKNKTLEYLNMSENGLGSETTPSLAYYISKSRKLRELDLTGNRFTESDANQIAAALPSNRHLEILRLGNNPLGASGALELVNAVSPSKSPNLKLELLDLENVWAEKEILSSLEILKNERPSLTIKLGGVLSNYKLHGPDVQKIFLRRAHHEALNPKKKKLSKDFGHLLLSLNDEVVASEFFKKSIKKFKLKLSQSLIDEIIKAFEVEFGQINLAAMKKRYLEEFPETQLPPRESRESRRKSRRKSSRKSSRKRSSSNKKRSSAKKSIQDHSSK